MGVPRWSARRCWPLAFVLVVAACSGSGGDAVGPTTSSPPSTAGLPATTTPPVAQPAAADELPDVVASPAAHEVVYRVERPATGVLDTERRVARGPFEVRIETRAGEPDEIDPGSVPRLLDLEVLGGAETGPVAQDRVLVVVPPRAALRSGRLDTDLAGAAAAGLVEPLGVARTIAGRRCVEIRTGARLDGGILQPPSETDHSDACVDEAGLVLREEVTVGGDVVERRTAVRVEIDPVLAPDTFDPLGWRIPEAQGGGRVRSVTADSRPPDVAHHQLAGDPPGTARIGRFGVLTDTAGGTSAAGTVDQVISMVDVHVGSGGLVVVENGASVTGAPVLGRGDVEVPLRIAPDATAVFLTTGVELRIPLPTGRFLRVTASLPLDEVVALTEAMVEVNGPGEVVPLDEEPDVTGRLVPPVPVHDHGAGADHDHGDARPDDHHHG